MFASIDHGVQSALLDKRSTALRGLPNGGTFQHLTEDVRDQCIAHAFDVWPTEAVGAAVEGRDGSITYVRLSNLHPAPEEHFRASEVEVLQAIGDGVLIGIHHSHPRACPHTGVGLCPSADDMSTQQSWMVPFYVTALSKKKTYMDFFGWGDQLPPEELLHRQFRSGVNDCFSLVRHGTFKLTGVVLPDGPRDLNWWDSPQGGNPIMDNLSDKGFEKVSMADARVGDAILISIAKGIVMHCGLYVGNDLFLHHLYGRLSSVDPLPQWRNHVKAIVRYRTGCGERDSP